MLDQIAYMDRLLDLEALAGRIEHYAKVEAGLAKTPAEFFIFCAKHSFGESFRGVKQAGLSARRSGPGRAVLTKAIDAGLLKSDTPKSPVRLAVPAKVLGAYFPQLFPVG